jgi:hypothetical protein
MFGPPINNVLRSNKDVKSRFLMIIIGKSYRKNQYPVR